LIYLLKITGMRCESCWWLEARYLLWSALQLYLCCKIWRRWLERCLDHHIIWEVAMHLVIIALANVLLFFHCLLNQAILKS